VEDVAAVVQQPPTAVDQ